MLYFLINLLLKNIDTSMKKTQIIAHRGFWKSNPKTAENSIQALKNAQSLDIYGSELDVQRTKDGVLIVYHDEHHLDLEIAETDYKNLVLHQLSNGEVIPTLEDYLRQGLKAPKLKLIIELKPAKTKALEDAIVKQSIALIDTLKMQSQCEFISFSQNICKEIKRIDADFSVFYLNGDLSPKEVKDEGLDGLDYDFEILLNHINWIAEARDLGLKTNSWTVNDIDVFKQLSDEGIDFITTNIPDQLK